MINIPPPFMKTSLDIQFMCFGIDNGVEDWMFEYKPRTIAVWIIFGNENFEAEHSLLVNALTNKNNTEPTCNKEIIHCYQPYLEL